MVRPTGQPRHERIGLSQNHLIEPHSVRPNTVIRRIIPRLTGGRQGKRAAKRLMRTVVSVAGVQPDPTGLTD
jgi:hypothetical protein